MGHGYYVQVGAFQARANAEDALGTLTASLDLENRQAIVPMERRGATLWRALIGPMERFEAQTACDDLVRDCFVVAAASL